MNVDELRAGLDRATEDVPDTGAVARTASVHQRVRRVRRRRQAAAAAGVAAVLAVVGTAVGLGTTGGDRDVPPAVEPNDPPAAVSTPDVLAGEPVESFDALLDDWDYVQGVESRPGDDSLTLDLPDDDHGRVIGFVTDMWSSDVTLSVDGTVLRREAGGTIGYPQYVDPGPHRIVLTATEPEAEGLLGLSVHRRPDLGEPELPTLVDGWSLLRATYGQDEASLTFTVPDGPFALTVECWPAGIAGEGRVLLSDDNAFGQSCQQYPEIPESGGDLWEVRQQDMEREGWVPGEQVTLQAEVTDYFAQRDDPYARRMQALFASVEHGMTVGVYVRP